jgi:hypothetical protein
MRRLNVAGKTNHASGARISEGNGCMGRNRGGRNESD